VNYSTLISGKKNATLALLVCSDIQIIQKTINTLKKESLFPRDNYTVKWPNSVDTIISEYLRLRQVTKKYII
jgi:hypothetical protein